MFFAKKVLSDLSFVSIALLGVASASFGETAADALLKSVGKSVAPPVQNDGNAVALLNGKDIKLTDPFLMQFFSEWQTQSNLSYDVGSWALRILKHEFAGAAHLWSAMQSKIPASFEPAAQAAYVYLLWRLDLPQTFFDEWTKLLLSETFLQSRFAQALDQTFAPTFDQWLADNAIVMTPEQENVIRKVPITRGVLYATLHAWASFRKGEAAAPILDKLTNTHKLKVPLAQTVALAMARKKDLAGAGAVLKRHLEPAIEASKDPKALSQHYLQVARLLYQAGALDASEQYYEKIPTGSPDFFQAREELAWVWLRTGNLTKLRGEITTLGTGLFDDQFAPEIYLIRAISNLKLCFYDSVEKDSSQFVETNLKWARTISNALKATESPAPARKDYFTRLSEQALARRRLEVNTLTGFGEQSVGASLPAVGPQSHWVRAKDKMLQNVELAKKTVASEYRRQWKNQDSQLREAIRKMQFVKVEFLSQVRALSKDEIKTDATVAKRGLSEEYKREAVAAIKAEGEALNFPFDGVIWPDELFRLRSAAQARCLVGTTK